MLFDAAAKFLVSKGMTMFAARESKPESGSWIIGRWIQHTSDLHDDLQFAYYEKLIQGWGFEKCQDLLLMMATLR